MENIRSAYNVGNILRTADALGRSACCAGYTPHPESSRKVDKTALWALWSDVLPQFWHPRACYEWYRQHGYVLFAAETADNALDVRHFVDMLDDDELLASMRAWCMGVIVWNETEGVLPETLGLVDASLMISMRGEKESLNVGQAAAIMMRELSRLL